MFFSGSQVIRLNQGLVKLMTLLGDPRFTDEIAVILGGRVIPGRAGRPCKKTAGIEDDAQKKP